MLSNARKNLTWGLIIVSLLFLLNPALANDANTLTRLTQSQISQQMKKLPDWTIEGGQLRRTYEFKNFIEAIAFVNRLVEPAEKAGHHPDIAISYNRVAISLTTHDAGGLTQQDFDLAQTISQLFVQMQSP